MLVDVGPSVTITSLTNFIAFLVGYFTPTPEIQLFCIGNAIAILFDFLYQITMYAALLSITGDLQMRDFFKSAINKRWSEQNEKFSALLDEYSQWLSSKFTIVFLLITLICYWMISIIGTMNIQVVLSADKLVLEDSLLNKMNYLNEKYVLINYTTANIFIQNPGNLSDPKQLAEVNKVIEKFEAFPECLGSNFSHYFVRDYEFFKNTVELEEQTSFGIDIVASNRSDAYSQSAMQPFFSWPEFRHWNGFVRFDKNGTVLLNFTKALNFRMNSIWVTVSYHGEQMGNDVFRKKMLERWRSVIDSFPHLNVSVFNDFSPFLDQLDSMLPATISTSICTLLCMMVVCFLFMYNLFTVIVATVSIISICIGVFGILSFWGIDLDPISMATTIMSIGFSVDFPAHITFHYYREGLEDPRLTPAKRVSKSLASIGFPLLQCGFSTIIFVLCLLFVRTYMSEAVRPTDEHSKWKHYMLCHTVPSRCTIMIFAHTHGKANHPTDSFHIVLLATYRVFVKTMVLVVTLGLIHGLILVPAFLCAFTSIYDTFFKSKIWSSQVSFSHVRNKNVIENSELSTTEWFSRKDIQPSSSGKSSETSSPEL
ncbi:patched family protein [Dictyocaulus viviparus]|uniref:Patched family protein n=1 Tax=Dictyocaulus viviparus TaxID=29172 RepID=A0A0D8Y0E0_DICVI|nr:patched family protein [Dictyocaulus viviparus]